MWALFNPFRNFSSIIGLFVLLLVFTGGAWLGFRVGEGVCSFKNSPVGWLMGGDR